MVARIAALVAAVAMIVAAVYARNRIDEHAVTARLVCSTELAEACTGLHASGVHITVEPAGVTFDRLVALAPEADPGVDGWLVAGPWPQMVDAERARRAESRLFTNTTAALASSPLVVTVETQRSVGVRATCKDPAPWSCVASLPAKTWRDLGANVNGQVKVDLPDPATESTGLAVLAAMSASVLGTRDFSRDDDSLRALVRGLKTAQTRPGRDALATVLTFPADIDTAMSTEADADRVVARAANPGAATRIYPAPVASINVVLGTPRTDAAATKLVSTWNGAGGRSALTGSGWKLGGGTGGADPGILTALRQMWEEQR